MREIISLLVLCGFLVACSREPQSQTAPSPVVKPVAPFKLVAGITDIMRHEIDPSADALWDSVGTYVDKKGTERG